MIKTKNDRFVLLVRFADAENFENNGSERIYPEIKGKREIKHVLESMGAWFFIAESEFYNTVTVEIDAHPVQVLKQFRKTPTVAIKSILPLDLVVSSTHNDIIKTIRELASIKIKNDESFKLRFGLNGRQLKDMKSFNELKNEISTELSTELKIHHQDKNTDWIINIEELGEEQGIAINRPEDILIK